MIVEDQWSLLWNAVDHTWSVLITASYHEPYLLCTLGPSSTLVVGLGQLGCLLDLEASGNLPKTNLRSQPHTGETVVLNDGLNSSLNIFHMYIHSGMSRLWWKIPWWMMWAEGPAWWWRGTAGEDPQWKLLSLSRYFLRTHHTEERQKRGRRKITCLS